MYKVCRECGDKLVLKFDYKRRSSDNKRRWAQLRWWCNKCQKWKRKDQRKKVRTDVEGI